MATQKIDIHQTACYYYLREMKLFYEKAHLVENDKPPYGELFNILKTIANEVDDIPRSNINYSKLYTKFQQAAESVAEHENKKENSHNSELDSLFLAIYENDSKLNQIIFEAITSDDPNLTADKLNQKIEEKTSNTNTLHLRHPDNRANAFFTSMMGWFGYNPLQKNNVPYVNTPSNLSTQQPKNLRFGNQTQKKDIVNPTFERYLLANARRRHEDDNTYQYVYFNLLKRSQQEQTGVKKRIAKFKDKFVRSSEGARSAALELLNMDKKLKVAVITLPADNDFLLKNFSLAKGVQTADTKENLQDVFKELAESIMFKKNDFYIHKKLYTQLFGKEFHEIYTKNITNKNLTEEDLETLFKGPLGKLFKESVSEAIPYDIEDFQNLDTTISPNERTALLFHFTKHNLTSHILDKLNPQGYNTTCKDAIDRGAVHTLWHQMNLQYKQKSFMSEKEFLCYMDSPAMSVKYRALNHNRNLLWNVLDQRMKTDALFAQAHPWAHQWLAQNNPALLTEKSHRPEAILPQKTVAGKLCEQAEISTDLETKTRPRTTPRA